jgi:uncharacterized protein (DUF362 family)
MDRRDFVKSMALLGAGLSVGGKLIGSSLEIWPDISVVTGENYFENTMFAMKQLGGIERFVKKGSNIGLLINAPDWWNLPGSHVQTSVALATLKMLSDAGAGSIQYLIDPSKEFYKRSSLSGNYESIIKSVKPCSGNFREVTVEKGISLKKARIIDELFTCDVFINIPVTKHHTGVQMTNSLKNYMGACHSETNQFFHKGSGAKNDYDDISFLSQCIADVNTIRKPDLIIADACEVLSTNGPWGPGEIAKPRKVYSGTNPVAMDAYGSTILGYMPEDILMIEMAQKHGLGSSDLKSIIIKENTI